MDLISGLDAEFDFDPGEWLLATGVVGLVLPGVAEVGLVTGVIGGRPGCLRYPLISPFGSSIIFSLNSKLNFTFHVSTILKNNINRILL